MDPENVRQQIEEKVARAIAQGALWAPGETIVVAVSGGADSLCLLHVLHALQPGHGGRLHVAHLDHGFRGATAAAEAARVVEIAHALRLPVTAGLADVPALMEQEHSSAEESARRVRYRFLAGVAAAEEASAIALGHTADDQSETVLMHILRGAGLGGLRGMRPAAPLAPWMEEDLFPTHPLRLVRPLLEVTRAETENYCAACGLTPAQDEWNQDPRFLRVRLRQEVFPLLETINPRVREALRRLADLAAWQEEDLDSLLMRIWPALARPAGEAVRLRLAGWRDLPWTLRLQALRLAVREVRGHLEDLGWEATVAAGRLDELDVGSEVALVEDVIARREYEAIVVGRRDDLAGAIPWLELGAGRIPLAVPGRTALPGGHSLWAEVLDREEVDWFQAGGGEAWLDAGACGARLWLRTRRPGDSFQPLGMAGHKKVQDFFVDEKIPHGERDRVPLVISPRGIVWIVGYRPDERFRITAGTQRVLHLRWLTGEST
jgi:tRNA(Ile)-lysidine synthetase-like protein